MNYYIVDVEGNSLYPSKLHVLSYCNVEDGEVKSITTYDGMREFLSRPDITIIGHNLVRFDKPVLERILNIDLGCRLIDTLGLSWYLYDDRDKHGLEVWGEYFGVPKPPITDWENEPLEVYIHRCEEDVKINLKLWKKMESYLASIYDTDEPAELPIIDYLNFKLHCAKLQEDAGWEINEPVTRANLAKLTQIKEEKVEALTKIMPVVAVYSKYKRPEKPFKKDGTLSEYGIKWKERAEQAGVDFNYTGDIKIVTSYKDANPNSPEQVKDWLFSLGWEPATFKYEKKEDGSTKMIPQVKKLFEPEFCDSVTELYEKEPNLEILEGLSIVNHRISILNGFLEKAINGRVTASVGGFTNTLRFKHIKPCVNLPGVTKLYGKEVRECLIAYNDEWELVGSDMTALEDLTKRHYMYPHDPDYVEAMSKPGYDPHLDLALSSGKVTEEQITFYRTAKPDELGANSKAEYKAIYQIRQDYKKTNYSGLYGIGKDKLARELKSTASLAAALLKDYWEKNWAVKVVAAEQFVRKVSGQMWLYNPVSRFFYSLRYEKDIFSTLNQSTGVYCFDSWIKEFLKEREQLTAQFHDEVCLCIKKGNRDRARKMLTDAIDKVNDKVKLNVVLSVDIKFGDSYAQIH